MVGPVWPNEELPTTSAGRRQRERSRSVRGRLAVNSPSPDRFSAAFLSPPAERPQRRPRPPTCRPRVTVEQRGRAALAAAGEATGLPTSVWLFRNAAALDRGPSAPSGLQALPRVTEGSTPPVTASAPSGLPALPRVTKGSTPPVTVEQQVPEPDPAGEIPTVPPPKLDPEWTALRGALTDCMVADAASLRAAWSRNGYADRDDRMHAWRSWHCNGTIAGLCPVSHA